jgi:hypothetical protein
LKRNVGRPLSAEEAQIATVRKLRKAGMSLRRIAEQMDLGLATVRTIVNRDDGCDRMMKKRWQKLHPGEKWEERVYTPIGKLTPIDPRQFQEEPWRTRTRAGLPKRITETCARSRVGEGGQGPALGPISRLRIKGKLYRGKAAHW